MSIKACQTRIGVISKIKQTADLKQDKTRNNRPCCHIPSVLVVSKKMFQKNK
jgi:hypothetical protein